jgi:hypothetical protein
MLITTLDKESSEDCPQIIVLRLLIKLQALCMLDKRAKLTGNIVAEGLWGCISLFLHDLVIALLLGAALQTLPGKDPFEKIHEDVADRL